MMPVLAALAGLFAVLLVYDSASQAAHAGWPLIAAAFLVLVIAALALWHRRRMAELHELHLVIVGRWRNAHLYHPWPKACRDCGQEVSNWRGARDHDNTETSSCARLQAHREARELKPAETPGPPAINWQADVIGPEDGPPPAPLPDENVLRSREWGQLDELIGRTVSGND